MALTDTAIRAAKARARPYKLGDDGGLFLLVTPTGGKLWKRKFRYAGKEGQLALGAYPSPVKVLRMRGLTEEETAMEALEAAVAALDALIDRYGAAAIDEAVAGRAP